MDAAATLKRTKEFLAAVLYSGGFEEAIKTLNIVDAHATPKGFVRAELKVEKGHCNMADTLHGATVCLLVDLVGNMTRLANTAIQDLGPSVELNVSFIRTAKLGETIVVEAQSLKNGRSIAFTSVSIYQKDDRALIASGRHSLINFRPESRL